jgi:hypothetical protein
VSVLAKVPVFLTCSFCSEIFDEQLCENADHIQCFGGTASIIREIDVISSDQIQVQSLVHEGSVPAYQGEQDKQGG